MRITISGPKTDPKGLLKILIERRVRFALTRFAPIIEGITATLLDESGPHGVASKRCRILVSLRVSGVIAVNSTGETFEQAASHAADRAGRSVARALARRRQNRRLPQGQSEESKISA